MERIQWFNVKAQFFFQALLIAVKGTLSKAVCMSPFFIFILQVYTKIWIIFFLFNFVFLLPTIFTFLLPLCIIINVHVQLWIKYTEYQLQIVVILDD